MDLVVLLVKVEISACTTIQQWFMEFIIIFFINIINMIIILYTFNNIDR